MKRALLVLVFALLVACSKRAPGGSVEVELMAFLSEARALHHQANLKEESGDIAGAVAAMDRLVHARQPGDASPEVQEVLADAYARMAELELRRGGLPAAAEAIRQGLGHAPEASYFRGHLLEVEGLIEEARAASLNDAGKSDEAAKARARAIQLLEEVVKIQDQVIQRSLDGRANTKEKP